MSLSFHDEHQVEVVTGMNLPMLIKLATLREEKPLDELAPFIKSLWATQYLRSQRARPGRRDMSADPVVEKEFTVRSELGLHARPAGRLASMAASRFQSEVTLGRGDEWVSGSSVLSILCLAAVQGTDPAGPRRSERGRRAGRRGARRPDRIRAKVRSPARMA